MQFLRQQRNGRKRKSYLERIGLDEKIESAEKFYEKYVILNRLQTGGQGIIHSITSKKSDEKTQDEFDELEGNETSNYKVETTLVVKIIFINSDIDEIPNELRKACVEYQLISDKSLLHHYGIYYDENNKQLLIVTEKLKMNLNELKYVKNKFNETQLKRIMGDILYKLFILHGTGYTHNDITPFNAMCNDKNEWKLIDFDMILEMDKKRGYAMDCWKGTIGWVSKEIGNDINSSNNEYSFSSDLWSFGLLLFFMLNDFKNPFELTQDEIVKHQLNAKDAQLEYYYKYKMIEKEYENELQCLLITWFVDGKISYNLYDLLLNHLLVFDVNDRIQCCEDVICHPWFYQYFKQNKHQYEPVQIETQGEIQGY